MALHIALINVRRDNKQEYDYFGGRTLIKTVKGINGYGIYPLSLAIIAALTPEKHHITIIDENIENIDFDIPYDIAAFTAMTWQAVRVYKQARKFRQKGIYTVMGGIHASFLPDEAAQFVDTIVTGEAELTWVQFVNDFEQNRAKSRYQADGFADLTKSPIPRYDLVKRDFYIHDVVQLTRGCPYSCSFCSVHKFLGRTVRKKSVEQVVKEITFLKECYYSKKRHYFDKFSIFFCDDNLAINHDYLNQAVTALEENDIVPDYSLCQSSMDTLKNEKNLDLFNRLHSFKIFVGVESISNNTLQGFNKKINHSEEYPAIINNLRNHGLDIIASFIIGSDEESADEPDHIIQFIKDNSLTVILINILTPYPGTELYKKMNTSNRITTKDWSKYDIKNVVFRPENYTSQQLLQSWLHIHKIIFSFPVFRKLVQTKIILLQSKKSNYFFNLFIVSTVGLTMFRTRHIKGTFSYLIKTAFFILTNKVNLVDVYDIVLVLDQHDFTLQETIRVQKELSEEKKEKPQMNADKHR